MTTSHYDRAFFEQQDAASQLSADEIVPLLVGALAPRSAVDVGCGTGTWASALRRAGVSRVVGVDGTFVAGSTLRFPEGDFVAHDLREPLQLSERFDLALCLEVAEHLPPARADGLVRDLVALADVVAFSAAIPGQGGTDHLTERWQDFWARLFRHQDMMPVDLVRPSVWQSPNVAPWYASNLLVYMQSAAAAEWSIPGTLPLSVVHPRMLELITARPPSARSLIRTAPTILMGSATRILRTRLRR